jgi:hypothetical protein
MNHRAIRYSPFGPADQFTPQPYLPTRAELSDAFPGGKTRIAIPATGFRYPNESGIELAFRTLWTPNVPTETNEKVTGGAGFYPYKRQR